MSKNKILIPVMQEMDESALSGAIKVDVRIKQDSTNNYLASANVEIDTAIDGLPLYARFTVFRPTQRAKDAGYHGRIGWRTVNTAHGVGYTTAVTEGTNSYFPSEVTFSPSWKAIIDKAVELKLAEEADKLGFDIPVSTNRSRNAKTTVSSANEVTEETVEAESSEASPF